MAEALHPDKGPESLMENPVRLLKRAWRHVIALMFVWAAALLLVVLLVPSAFAQGELTRKVRNRVAPSYPELARRMNIRGTVKVLVVVSSEGNLKQSKVVGGNPILVNAAMDALKKWKFEPGQGEATGTVEFEFRPAE